MSSVAHVGEHGLFRRGLEHSICVQIESQGQVFKAGQLGGPRPPTGGVRGEISGYSRASHRRNITMHQRIDFKRAGGVCFMTPTFPPETYKGLAWAKDKLRAFMKRLKRQHPKLWYTWKVEPHQNGIAHFHLLVGGMPYVQLAILREMWRQVIGGDRLPLVHVKFVRDPSQVVRYVTKYVGKLFDVCLLVKDAYLATDEKEPSSWWQDWRSPGRLWGVEWRESVPWAPWSVVKVHSHKARDFIIRQMRRVLEHKGFHRSRLPAPLQRGVREWGFTLWVGCASEMLLWAVQECIRRGYEVEPVMIEVLEGA